MKSITYLVMAILAFATISSAGGQHRDPLPHQETPLCSTKSATNPRTTHNVPGSYAKKIMHAFRVCLFSFHLIFIYKKVRAWADW